jgi:hypothetical protein
MILLATGSKKAVDPSDAKEIPWKHGLGTKKSSRGTWWFSRRSITVAHKATRVAQATSLRRASVRRGEDSFPTEAKRTRLHPADRKGIPVRRKPRGKGT